MKLHLLLVAMMVVPACAAAQERKSCEDLKTEIAAKLDAKGVKGYTLEIVPKDQETTAKVVGTCDGGTKKITYAKGEAAAKPVAEATKPQ